MGTGKQARSPIWGRVGQTAFGARGLALTWALVVVGCGGETTKKDSKDVVEDVALGVDGLLPDPSDSAGDSQQPDVPAPDTAVKDADSPDQAEPVDINPVDTSGCATATDCVDLEPSACQQAACVDGACQLQPKPGSCCSDDDCDDGIECTTDQCDTAKHTCLFLPIVNCCSGKVTLAKTSFETDNFDDWQPNDVASNGNVTWQLTGHRAHSGKSSLYFGNECQTYDNTMTADGGCQPSGLATAVSTVLTSKPWQLPKDKKAQLHFWLFLDVEPAYAGNLKPGVCDPACQVGHTCVDVSGLSQCIPEKDVLVIDVQTADAITPVFHSTAIGKSTSGGWQHIAVDLSAWQGQTVKLRWRFDTGTGLNNAYEGLYLDDIVVETLCADAAAACEVSEPCPDDGVDCTVDVCTAYQNLPGLGVCLYDRKPGCCQLQKDCDDGNACTVDSCSMAEGAASGVCSSVPDAGQPACCKPEVVTFHDFESATLDQWTSLGNNSNLIKWRIYPKGGQNGSVGLYFGGPTFDSYSDPALGTDTGAKGTICTKPMSLKKGTLHNLLQFSLNLETEWTGLAPEPFQTPWLSGPSQYDVLSVQIYSAGVFEMAWSSAAIAGSTEGKWLEVVVPLDPWQGKNVQVCLQFDAGDAKANDNAGPRIDDFMVQVACNKKPCYFDVDCAALACAPCFAPKCGPSGCACAEVANCCTADIDCDDGDPCTSDVCSLLGQCGHAPSQAEGCPDGN